MKYTIFVRQTREVEIQAENLTQLRQIMEHSFKPEGRCELEEWSIHTASRDDGTIASEEVSSFWLKFPEGQEDE